MNSKPMEFNTFEEAVKAANEWRKIAEGLVYTEHDDYAHYHGRKDNRCERCLAHEAYHDTVDHYDNP